MLLQAVSARRLAGEAGPGPERRLFRRAGLTVQREQQQQQAGPGVNDRVREWMLDVERQSGGGSVDQRSQSSKGAVKTSPRSVAVTHCVPSPSQL